MEEVKRFSLSEVTLHSSKKDCWLVIHDKVYDVTKFLEDHPGGEDVLIHASANGDATDSFEDVGHSSTATAMMMSFQIGVLDSYDAGSDAGASAGVAASAFAAPKTNPTAAPNYSLSDYLLPLLILVVATAAWYYLTVVNKA
ncbi:hypothetical protein QJS10_CPB19g00770 [Acorus calamus]|uniref:Cytochrome b5 heme-binding domain-containing protein n=1 Tax=Acorus calamus TaxID=4465 RepID=A0AAV9CFU7_ACOCL|nr:hypothetical protein QJS10_CPB19g00770 [Acorus calamus]